VEAEAMHRQTLQLREKVLGVEHPWTLTSMSLTHNIHARHLLLIWTRILKVQGHTVYVAQRLYAP
jgi:hypothetical protein